MSRVFILSSHPLFGEGVELLLRRERRVDVVGRESDIDRGLARIRELRPDVVLVDGSDLHTELTSVLRVLREGVGSRVIRIDLQDNTLCICYSEQRAVRGIEDLLAVLEHNTPPSRLPAARANS